MQRWIEQNNVSLFTETFGRVDDPVMLLVMGATASMLGWPDEFCEALASRGLFVIRFDHRDTGQSTTVSAGDATYTVEDLAADCVAILDAYGTKTAHLVGMSLGGYLAQMVAVEHSDRVRTLTLIASEPLGWDREPLPHISEAFLDHFGVLGTIDWSDREAVVGFLVESERLCVGSDMSFDHDRERSRVERVLSRTDSPASMFNHGALSLQKDWTGRFREIACPVLVIHGEVDPILPVENGRAIAAGLGHAAFIGLPGVGHEIPLALVGPIAAQIAKHVHTSL